MIKPDQPFHRIRDKFSSNNCYLLTEDYRINLNLINDLGDDAVISDLYKNFQTELSVM